jgi:hypothetical protein
MVYMALHTLQKPQKVLENLEVILFRRFITFKLARSEATKEEIQLNNTINK